MIVAALIGLFFGSRHDRHLENLRRHAEEGNLIAYNRDTEKYKAGATAHAHSFLFSVIVVLVAMIVNRLPLPQIVVHTIPYLLVGSTVVWTFAALRVIRPLMGLADIVFLLTMIGIAYGLVVAASP
jgi:hypothetical protein